MKSEKGFSLIETAAALAILGILAVAFLGGMGTSLKATTVARKQATAQSLVMSQIEYVKGCTYNATASVYPVDPALVADMPAGWSIPTPAVVLVHPNNQIQKVTVQAEYSGNVVLSMITYKVNR